MSFTAFAIMYAYIGGGQYGFAIFMGLLGVALFVFWIKKRNAIKCIVDAFWKKFVPVHSKDIET